LAYKSIVLLATVLLTSPFSSAEAACEEPGLGEALLGWTPPTQNEDGSQLTDLTSYEIWNGCEQSRSYDTVEVVLAPAVCHTVTGLPDTGTCYFAAKATNSEGVSSVFSNEATKLMAALVIPEPVRDLAVAWSESQELTISNTLPSTYKWGVLALDELVYIDRNYIYTSIPSELVGLDYLRTANTDKDSSDPDHISFDVSTSVTVFVAHDSPRLPTPGWLAAWAPYGDLMWNNDTTFTLYSRDFPAGRISLGGNSDSGAYQGSMYSVMVK